MGLGDKIKSSRAGLGAVRALSVLYLKYRLKEGMKSRLLAHIAITIARSTELVIGGTVQQWKWRSRNVRRVCALPTVQYSSSWYHRPKMLSCCVTFRRIPVHSLHCQQAGNADAGAAGDKLTGSEFHFQTEQVGRCPKTTVDVSKSLSDSRSRRAF